MEIQQTENQLSTLSDERITAEILIYKDQVGYGMIELGKRLIEMKKRLGHGKFLDYLANEVEFSRMTANNFIRMAEQEPNVKTFLHLGVSKIYALLDVPTEDREDFISTTHQVKTKNGIVEKTVEQMTVREVEQVIKLEKELKEKDSEIQRLKQDNVNFNTRIGHERESRIFAQNQLEKKELELKQANKQKPETIVKTEIIYEESPELQKALWEAEQEKERLKNETEKANRSVKELQKELENIQLTQNKRDELERQVNEYKRQIQSYKETSEKFNIEINAIRVIKELINKLDLFLTKESMNITLQRIENNEYIKESKIELEKRIKTLYNWILTISQRMEIEYE